MRYTSRLLVLTNVLGIVQGTALPQITQAPYLHEKRDDAHVTLNIGPISIYQQTTVSPTLRPRIKHFWLTYNTLA